MRASPSVREPLPTPSGLLNDLIRFDAFLDERIERFVGRHFLFEAVDSFLDAHPSGYLIIDGLPGVGKSAFLAKLVRDRGYVHHFNSAASGITSAAAFLRNVCAQLIVAWSIPLQELPPDVGKSGAFLSNLLHGRGGHAVGDVVIVIDALDEVDLDGHPPDANLLWLPESLPDGVFVVATTRPTYDLRLRTTRDAVPLHLVSDDRNNIADIEEFIRGHLPRPGIREWMYGHGMDDMSFTELLKERSEYNFMYLRHVLPALEKRKDQSFSAADLPQGLLNYYRCHWGVMHLNRPDLFEAAYKPIILSLGAARRPMTERELCEDRGVPPDLVRATLRDWSEFLSVHQCEARGTCYRIYHSSFLEYLRDEVDPGFTSTKKVSVEAWLAEVESRRG